MQKSPAPILDVGQDSATNLRVKITVLVLLAFQNAGFALLTRYSRGILKETYSNTEVVIVAELIKTLVSGYFTVTDTAKTDSQGRGISKLIWLVQNCSKIIVLVILYSAANLLSFYALGKIDAAGYSVLLQLKILSTAACAVIFLGRTVSNTKWRALILLVIACILVVSPAFTDSASGTTATVSIVDEVFGYSAVIVMVVISGLASVYFEKILKLSPETITIWERNFQLAFCSVLLLSGKALYDVYASSGDVNDANKTNSEPEPAQVLFAGWTFMTFIIACMSAAGGLLVAATLKYADAILKTLANSGAIVIAALFGYLLLDGPLDIFLALGCVTTILAICNYTFDTTTST
mmetsp:Transcript_14140/g.23523  ORF Transcript_14140/g.23523 Transcript_14140/m.23523 type:complete len:351 (-) Transcript_14140:40-1092(-)|eukprot:CAMPEP_0175024778 /NCGR_PEP_ID=MMETSP0005-20121125/16671_1 /TAXON_ID=420556 /ORGANISM="Ochromonas sp., Strain CCMP1393" /LENGTH=350 /DNA_ID=CAMNT_0016283399 /DNA_START=1 /DNA_END=1053 /DNA_ORIENTATION=+